MTEIDMRPIEELRFADASPPAEREAEAEWVRAALTRVGARVAAHIAEIGCTGCHVGGLAIPDIRRLRLGVGGSGVGLTCYVPPTRYCYAHETIGGYEDGKDNTTSPAGDDTVRAISRALTPEEKIQVKIIDRVRNLPRSPERADRAAEILSGRDRTFLEEVLDEDATAVSPLPLPMPPPASASASASPAAPEGSWRCAEHSKPFWPCRYCIAAGIVHGNLEPKALLVWADGDESEQVEPTEIDARVAQLGQGETAIALYVRAARWSRRLALEE
jgi:hypothetical protein